MTAATTTLATSAITATHLLPSRRSMPVPLLPNSHTWQDFGSLRFHLMLQQAFIMQVAHPIIDAGVGEHSVYRTDPWGRAKRSVELLWPVVYARPMDAIRKGIELRELHRRIKGVDKNGKAYKALDPEAYGWVHFTGFDATLRAHPLFGKAPTVEQRQQIFSEWRQMGMMMGIADKHLPATEQEYWQHFEYIIRERLSMGEVATDLLSKEFYQQVPKPPESRMPDFVWKSILGVAGPLMRFNTIGTLPALFRERMGIDWGKKDERLFRLWCRLWRVGYRFLPFRVRFIPLAQKAIQDARKHPEAYRLPDTRELDALFNSQTEQTHDAG